MIKFKILIRGKWVLVSTKIRTEKKRYTTAMILLQHYNSREYRAKVFNFIRYGGMGLIKFLTKKIGFKFTTGNPNRIKIH